MLSGPWLQACDPPVSPAAGHLISPIGAVQWVTLHTESTEALAAPIPIRRILDPIHLHLRSTYLTLRKK